MTTQAVRDWLAADLLATARRMDTVLSARQVLSVDAALVVRAANLMERAAADLAEKRVCAACRFDRPRAQCNMAIIRPTVGTGRPDPSFGCLLWRPK